MRNPGGYGQVISPQSGFVWFDPDRKEIEHIKEGLFEVDTFTCGHCGRVSRVKPKMDAADCGGLCKGCMRLVCKYCVGKKCDVLEKKLERAEKRERLWRACREN